MENILDRMKLLMKYSLNETYSENRKKILNEEDISSGEMEGYVDTAVDDLDGFVDTGNLKSLLDILNALKGKTYRGKDAVSEFLRLYSIDEGGDSFVKDVNSVGIKTLGALAQDYKDDIIAIANGQNVPSPTPTTTTTTNGKTPPPKDNKNKTSFTACQAGKYVRGCKDQKIKEVQVCLGMQAKHQTGNFGPITQGELQKLGKGFENGFTDKDVQTICNLGKNKGGGDFYDVDTPGGSDSDVIDIDKLP